MEQNNEDRKKILTSIIENKIKLLNDDFKIKLLNDDFKSRTKEITLIAIQRHIKVLEILLTKPNILNQILESNTKNIELDIDVHTFMTGVNSTFINPNANKTPLIKEFLDSLTEEEKEELEGQENTLKKRHQLEFKYLVVDKNNKNIVEQLIGDLGVNRKITTWEELTENEHKR